MCQTKQRIGASLPNSRGTGGSKHLAILDRHVLDSLMHLDIAARGHSWTPAQITKQATKDFTGSILISASKDGRLKGWHTAWKIKHHYLTMTLTLAFYCRVRIMVETLSLVVLQTAKYLLGKLAGRLGYFEKNCA